MDYKEGVPRAGIVLVLAFGAALGCSRKSVANPEDYAEIGKTFEDAGPRKAGPGKTVAKDPEPLPGVDLDKLTPTARKRFEKLVDSLPSPCGKAHSLRKSVLGDHECKRAPFAVRYVARLCGDDLDESEVRALYQARYRQDHPKSFTLSGIPHAGPDDAKVVLVEFFDYGCPHCAEFAPLIDQLLDKYPSDVVIYFKNFPLGSHPESVPAAKAALAAARQGKFEEMHRLLFEHQEAHGRQDLLGYARSLGLDLKRFETDLDDPALEQRIMADRKEGEEAGLMGTPGLFIGGRECPELSLIEISDWVDEELAVNR